MVPAPRSGALMQQSDADRATGVADRARPVGLSCGGGRGNGPAGNGPAGNGPAWNGPAWNGLAWNGLAGNGPSGNGPSGNGLAWSGNDARIDRVDA